MTHSSAYLFVVGGVPLRHGLTSMLCKPMLGQLHRW